jgi:hypothetical protein
LSQRGGPLLGVAKLLTEPPPLGAADHDGVAYAVVQCRFETLGDDAVTIRRSSSTIVCAAVHGDPALLGSRWPRIGADADVRRDLT